MSPPLKSGLILQRCIVEWLLGGSSEAPACAIRATDAKSLSGGVPVRPQSEAPLSAQSSSWREPGNAALRIRRSLAPKS